MTNLIVEISKYLMILLMAVYTYANFRFFSFPDMERKRRYVPDRTGPCSPYIFWHTWSCS